MIKIKLEVQMKYIYMYHLKAGIQSTQDPEELKFLNKYPKN